ncbi:MAG: LuxR C-terminal-related transcriptional regulator [Ktedonobacteraceae bacterium]
MGLQIVLADHRYLSRKGIRYFLTHELAHNLQEPVVDSVEEVSNRESLNRLLISRKPDFVFAHQSLITNIMLFPKDHFAILTPAPDKEIFLIARKHGITAYLAENPSKELLQEVLQLALGDFLIDPAFTNWMLKTVARKDQQNDQIDLLTPMEGRIAALLHKGLSHAEIAQQLSMATSTVKRHSANISAKRKTRA